jgi:hypothetical protein
MGIEARDELGGSLAGAIEAGGVAGDAETLAKAGLGSRIDAPRSRRGAEVTRIDDEIVRIALRGMAREPRDVTIDALAVAIDARGVGGASLGGPCASLEVIDRCQRVPGAAKVELCVAQSDIFGAVPASSAALAPTGAPFGAFRETLFGVSASRGAPSAAFFTPRAALFTPSASIVATSAALGAPSGGPRGTSRGSRRSSWAAGGSERVDRGNDRRGRGSSGVDRRDERVDRRTERGSGARSRGAECASRGAFNPNAMRIRELQVCDTRLRLCRMARRPSPNITSSEVGPWRIRPA